jgi:hypothetical protein
VLRRWMPCRGFDGGREHTLAELGRMFGISRERVRQVEQDSRARLARDERLVELGSDRGLRGTAAAPGWPSSCVAQDSLEGDG